MEDNRVKKLQVKDLSISFRTVNGKLQAVRDISFDLYQGETLAIVGESGSGKSATSKTILGISANNTIIEGGEILYDGKDLLKIDEEEFHTIRGDKIAMVFQDPLSSLNPIMRIGKQLTEATLLKNKANKKECGRKLDAALKALDEAISHSDVNKDSERFNTFRKIIKQQNKYQASYEVAYASSEAGLKAAEDLLIVIDKQAYDRIVDDTKEFKEYFLASFDRFVIEKSDELKATADRVEKTGKLISKKKDVDYEAFKNDVETLKAALEKGYHNEKVDFFALGCYEVLNNTTLDGKSAKEINEITKDIYDCAYLKDFNIALNAALKYSANKSSQDISVALIALEETYNKFALDLSNRAEIEKVAKNVSAIVENVIDPLETIKASKAYTFKSSLKSALAVYYNGIKNNEKEEKRYAKDKAKYDEIIAKGKQPSEEVKPLSLVDMDLAKENILKIVAEMKTDFINQQTKIANYDFKKRTENYIVWLREMAVGEIKTVTRSMAKDRAIRVMEQVGIPEARKRYSQYPFEFSGGMRQRIVIAISLSANPDILICDEPTTALDVTIQAQILELINKLKKERDLSVIFITHDMGVVANMADRIAVMYAGKIVEYGTSEDIFYHPAHPYTWALLASIPDLESKSEKLEAIPGTPPNMIYPPVGDAFAARNKYAMQIDFEQQPPMFKISDTHYAATWLLHPDAPKVEMPPIVVDRIKRMNKESGEQ